ncbi:MAG: hypothetical protein M3Y33_09905 [Actinomycetota bacterium]|nr:hypothetical protein [Actinomycetota bacterium]
MQFPDGRSLALGSWPAYAAELQRRAERRKRAAALPKPPEPAMRKARDPFDGRPVQIEVSEPSWLGVAP